ncbi:MAG TPA: DNA polymerase I [Steroidobacteraceae bacterium]|nr:DNA polymerase I [Steroidobacteraceae bacterium]
MTQPTLVLVDGSSYLYRAFHAMPPLTNAAGEPTGALLGVLNMIVKLTHDFPEARLAIVFDAPGRTFRDDLFEAYKSHRPAMPDDLHAQIEPLLEMIRAQGLPLLRVEGVEADDVIGTLAKRAEADGQRVIISTGDKDMAQLVNAAISIVNTMTGSHLDRAGVKAKFDVWPEQIVDYLALVGDSSDNIPGVPKVGPKTAAKWLAQYGTADGIIAHAHEIEGKVGENLRNGIETLALSRKLATLHTQVELPLGLADLEPRPVDGARLQELYTRYELRSFLRQLTGAAGEGKAAGRTSTPAPIASATVVGAPAAPAAFPTPPPRQYETVTRWEQLQSWLARLRAAPLIAFDTETTSLDYMNAEIVGVSFCAEPGSAAYVPVGHDYAGAPEQLPRARVLEALKPLLEDAALPKLGQHLKYDCHVLANYGIHLQGMRYDTMLESYVWNSVATRHDMDSAAAKYLGIQTIKFEQVAGKGARQLTFNQVPVERAAEYAAEDADVTMQLHQALWAKLQSVPALAKLYAQIEQPLVPVLARMEYRGVLIDGALLAAQSRQIDVQLRELIALAHKEAGAAFNVDSPRQLQQILFERLQIPVLRKTSTGQPSTAEDVLEELAETHALPRIVLDYRALAKLKSTYTDKLPEQIDLRTGRVHTSYHQAVAQTGRLSSTDPNLQNIPIRRPEGRRIRQAFIAPPGHVLLAADYSQIELRIMAHLSGDPGLVAAFAGDQDVHVATAAEVFGVPAGAVSSDQRRTAKTINFGLIYGMSPFGLARQLGIDRGSAQEYVNRYFARYPGVRQFMDDTRERARREGYVETVSGRRLYLPDIGSSNRQLQQYSERSAINAPMQGTAADIIKLAMIRVDEWCERERPPARLIMQVHDELVLEVQADAVAEVTAAVRRCMVEALQLKVPLKVDTGVGANWDEAH